MPYPQPGRPLLPPPLDSLFGDELLDPWREADFDPGLRWRDLGERVWAPPRGDVLRLGRFVTKRLGARLGAIAASDAFALERPIPLAALDLPARVENSLRRHGYIRGEEVRPIRLRDLARLRNIGPRAILEFLLQVEPLRAERLRAAGMAPDAAVRSAADPLRRARWARSVSSRDPRFGPDIRSVYGAATNAAEAAEHAASWPTLPPSQTATRVARLHRALERARSADLPEELKAILRTLVSPAHARALRRRFGWDGRPPGTLREAAETIGVTQERVRQVQLRVIARVRQRGRVWTPALDRALALLERCGECDDRELARRLRSSGLSMRPFTREALLTAKRVLASAHRPTT